MYKFTVEQNEYLEQEVQGYYYDEYHGGENWKIPETLENMLTTIKNDKATNQKSILQSATNRLEYILKSDLPKIINDVNLDTLVVCVIPRAKREISYKKDQLLFKATVKKVVNSLNKFKDGTEFIARMENTRTTHRNRYGQGGDGKMPYPGITKDTCYISKKVKGKDILLIDDIYTKTVNIDEDAIQALFDSGARSVIFYAIGKTVKRD